MRLRIPKSKGESTKYIKEKRIVVTSKYQIGSLDVVVLRNSNRLIQTGRGILLRYTNLSVMVNHSITVHFRITFDFHLLYLLNTADFGFIATYIEYFDSLVQYLLLYLQIGGCYFGGITK